MQKLYQLSRYLLPTVFFGYALLANVVVFQAPAGKIAPLDLSVFKGVVTASIDTVYKQSLPHRAAAIGLIGAARYALIGEGRSGVIAGKAGWLFTAEEARATPTDLAATLAHIGEIRATLAKAGVNLVLVPVPAKVDVQAEMAMQPALSAQTAALYARFLAGLHQQGVKVVETRTALLALHQSEPAFFATDTHWTRAGAIAVAQAVAASGQVAIGQNPGTLTEDAAQNFAGDLVSFVTSDAYAASVGLPLETVTPYTAGLTAQDAGLGDLFGPATADVILVGTSYSANPNWSFAEALKLSLRQDVLNFAAVGRGPVQPMREYLASVSFADAPPKVVIWEFPIRFLTDPQLWTAPDNQAGADSAT